jgi:hypothetical protein
VKIEKKTISSKNFVRRYMSMGIIFCSRLWGFYDDELIKNKQVDRPMSKYLKIQRRSKFAHIVYLFLNFKKHL